MLIMNTTFFIGAILLSLSTEPGQFAVGRIFVGIGSGFMTVVISMYIAEVSPSKYRGALGSFLQLFLTIGIIIIECIGLGLSSAIGWRIVVVITVGPAIIQMLCLPFCARSPRWLISQNRIDEARAALQKLRGDARIDQEFYEMVQGVQGTVAATAMLRGGDEGLKVTDDKASGSFDNNQEEKGDNEQESHEVMSMLDVMRDPVMRRIGFTVFVHHIIQQLSGMNAVMYYSSNIFLLAFNGSESMSQIMAIVTTIVNFVATIFAVCVIDRFGRRPLLLIAEAGTCIFSVLLVIGYKTNTPGLLIASVFLYVASFAVGIGPIPWLITSEMTPTYAASSVGAASTCINWCMNFLIGQVFPVIFAAIQGWSFLIFAVICALAFCFTFFALPETKGRSLESIVAGYDKYKK